jgi:hypothetical protein
MKKMITVGMRKGFADKETISLSEELDKLINLSLNNHKLMSSLLSSEHLVKQEIFLNAAIKKSDILFMTTECRVGSSWHSPFEEKGGVAENGCCK